MNCFSVEILYHTQEVKIQHGPGIVLEYARKPNIARRYNLPILFINFKD